MHATSHPQFTWHYETNHGLSVHGPRSAHWLHDTAGDENHSAVLTGDKLEGLTNSTGRDFLSYWSATKAK